jgi:hypothetical protein
MEDRLVRLLADFRILSDSDSVDPITMASAVHYAIVSIPYNPNNDANTGSHK